MEVFIYIMIFVLMSGLAVFVLYKDTAYVRCVEAGVIHEKTAKELNALSYYTKRKKLYSPQGEYLKDYFEIKVSGNCMKPRGINDGSICAVETFGKDVRLKPKDIIMIHLVDSGIYKIREIKDINGSEITTFYYDENGNEKLSSRKHNLMQVVGVVRYI